MEYIKGIILENKEVIKDIYKMVVKASLEHCKSIKPGQFYMLRGEYIEPLLPRPISVCEISKDTITFIYAKIGRGTKEFSKLKKEDSLMLTGPLGNGFNIEEAEGRIGIVAGGIGTAPMLELVKRIRENKVEKVEIDIHFGFRDDYYLIDEIKGYVDNIYISTDTGKYGHKGFVTDLLKVSDYKLIYCCGPEPMMNKVVLKARENNVKIYVSTEKHMACGVGACLVCTCKTKEGNKRSCKDGPVFNGEDLVIE